MSNDGISDSPFVLVSSPGMHDMATSIRDRLKERGAHFPHYEVEFTTFSSGEVLPVIPHTVRRQNVIFLHPLQHPDPNTAFMMMLLANDALRRADVAGITLVAPFFPYLRQDRKDQPRVPISARLMADLIESNPSVQRIITIDMHTDQEQGFFSIPVDNLNSRKTFAAHVLENYGDLSDVMVISPDFGGALRARRFASRIGDVPVGIIEKRRTGPND